MYKYVVRRGERKVARWRREDEDEGGRMRRETRTKDGRKRRERSGKRREGSNYLILLRTIS
jgi:hypothetical protein